MRTSVCHYSFHRLWQEEQWDCDRLCREVRAVGAQGVDFHQRLTGDPLTARERIARALERSAMALSGISLSNNYNRDPGAELDAELAASRQWIDIAADLGAPVCRIFGGDGAKDDREAQLVRTREALRRITQYAAKKGVVLALENHGGMPTTGEEQVRLIREVGSPSLGATIDVGNYMSGGQEGVDGTKAAAPYCRYVHVKDFMKVRSSETAWGWKPQACTVGVGDVDIDGCLRELVAAGYQGWVALEYEGPGPERVGVAESMHVVRRAVQKVTRATTSAG